MPIKKQSRRDECQCIKEWLLPMLLASSSCLVVARQTIESVAALLHKWHKHDCDEFFKLPGNIEWRTLAVSKEALAAQAQMLALTAKSARGKTSDGKKIRQQ